MAEVYVAERAGPRGFAKRFAVKRILPELAQDQRFVAMFCDEARICAGLSHPNIVQVVDFGESNGELFMAMEFVEGVSLARLLRTVSTRRERFPMGAACHIVQEVLRGLAFAHEALDEHGRPLGIVHRDVSPGNVLIGRAGEVKLGDFGILRSAFVDRRTYPGELKGKIGYMSPEQVMGSEVDPRSDLFTVGIILAEMLLARPLFSGQNEFEILSNIYEANLGNLDRYGSELPEPLLALLRHALARAPADRYQTANEFLIAIREVAKKCSIGLGDGELSPWLSSLGVLPSRSGTHEVNVPNAGAHASAGVGSGARPSQPTELMSPNARPTIGPFNARGPVSGPMSGKTPASASEAPQFGEELTSVATWKNPLERRALPALLYGIAVREESGALVVRHGAREKQLFFVRGELRAALSNEQGELLGARLLRTRRVAETDLRAALAASQGGQRTLGDELVQRGVLRPTSLLRELIEQLEERFVELFAWDLATLWFLRGVRVPALEIHAPSPVPALVTRAVRDCYRDQEIAGFFAPTMKLRVTRGLTRGVDPARLGLTLAERRALERAPKVHSIEALVAELAAEQLATPAETLRGLYMGVSLGVIAVQGFSQG